MTAANKISNEEYRRTAGLQNSRKTRTVRKNDPKTEVLKQTVAEIRRLLPHCPNKLFASDFGIEITINGSRKADIDNVGKGILDALQGYAFENDRYCEDFRVRRSQNIQYGSK